VPVDIAFVTVNYNTKAYVSQLADFFRQLDAPFTFSFTVVDNNSKDGSQEILGSFPNIHYLQAGENIGYGRSINRGVVATESKYVCVMNTDVILNREALVRLWRFLEEHPEAGIGAPRLKYEDGRDQGMLFHPSLLSHYVQWYAKAKAGYGKWKIANAAAPARVDGVMGAFFLIRRCIIPSSGLFDEDFFFFHEDTALAHSLKNRGVPCFVLPDATVVHVGGQSRSDASIAAFYESKYLYLKKFYGPVHSRAVSFLDRARFLRKWWIYSLYSTVNPSERVKSKQQHYKTAWNAVAK